MDFFFYLVCCLAGFLFTIVSAFLGHAFGGGHEGHFDAGTGGHDGDVGTGGHADAGFENTGMPGVSPFSPLLIACFITAFGGFGLVLRQISFTRNPLMSAPLSAIGAFAIAAGLYWLLATVFSKTQSSSESHVASVVGMTATIITPIPANGVGEIAYVQAGSRYTAPAREEKGAAVANGQAVKIVRVVASQFYVTPV
jgi:amino acid transporter